MLIDTGRAYLLALIFSSILAWTSFFGIIFFTNPADAGILGVTILYVGFSVGVGGFGLIIWQIINRKKN